MKKVLILAFVLVGVSAQANWIEKVDCLVERGSVDYGIVTTSVSSTEIEMRGRHNNEHGKVIVKNSLTPSYKIILKKVSHGRTGEMELITKLGKKVIAKSSVDEQQVSTVSNRFMTFGGDYQITVTCSSDIQYK